jgi:trypsin
MRLCCASSTTTRWYTIVLCGVIFSAHVWGQQNESVGGRIRPNIVGGTRVFNGTYPSYVHPLGSGSLCGATLIHADILLTAAHCRSAFPYGRNLAIGATARNGSDALENTTVVSTYGHPFFEEGNFTNDFMLVKISTSSAIPISAINRDSSHPMDDVLVTVIGFGRTSFGSGSFSNNLLEAKVNIVPFSTCNSNYNTILDMESMLCAAAMNKDACTGDSGSPLFDEWGIIVGVVSFGDGCANIAKPGVYARVSNAVAFIEEGICSVSDVPPPTCPSTPTPSASPVFAVPAPTYVSMPTAIVPIPTDPRTEACPMMIFSNHIHKQYSTGCQDRCVVLLFRLVFVLFGWEFGPCP